MAGQFDMQGIMQQWMDTQRKLWDEWMQHVQGAAGGSLPWAQGLTHWKEAVDKTLDTQKQATRAWADKVAQMEGAPEEMKKWASEGVTLVEQWSDAQQGLWDQWFSLMSSAAPHAGDMPGSDQMRQVMAGWEQAASQMQELQRQWVAAFSGLGKRG